MNRSEVRHALYRAKNGVPVESKQYIYDKVKPLIPEGESWETFSTGWDVFVKDENITVIRPEDDYDFIHSTCLEKCLHVRNGMKMKPTERQANALQIVELNMLEGKMRWDDYNNTWGVVVDKELRRISTRLYKTEVNVVTEEMIRASAPSDGAAMTKTPELDTIVVDFEAQSE